MSYSIEELRILKARVLECNPNDLVYYDYNNYGKRGVVVYWNCINPNHRKYQSTVAVRILTNGVIELGS